MNNKFSENLKKIRKDNNLSQEQLADEIGVSRQAISKWESRVAYPEMDKIISLCDKFNLNIDDLLHKDIQEVKREEESKKKLNKSIDDFLKFITDTINLFSNMNFKSKIKCLFEQAVIILILYIISFIFVAFSNYFLQHIFQIFPDNMDIFLRDILVFVIIIFCVIVSVMILTHIFKTRYLDYYNKLKSDTNNDEKENFKDDNKEKVIDKENKVLFKENEKKIIIRDPKHSEYKFINGLFKLIILVIKFFALCFSLFLCFILICLLGSFIISFLTYKTGIFFIGLIFTTLSISVIDIILILIIFNFVFNRKNDKKKMIWSFISSLVVVGIGSGMILIGTLNFDVLDNNETMLETKEIEFAMNDNTFIDSYYDVNIEYVEFDIDNIKMEYEINKLCKLNNEVQDEGAIHVWAYCSNPTKLTKAFISNVNDKKIISINNDIHSIVIYASKENIEKLQNNRQKYIEDQRQYRNTLDEYEDIISTLNEEVEDLRIENEKYENKIYELEDLVRTYTQTNSNDYNE